jgi:hypothetical protein
MPLGEITIENLYTQYLLLSNELTSHKESDRCNLHLVKEMIAEYRNEVMRLGKQSNEIAQEHHDDIDRQLDDMRKSIAKILALLTNGSLAQ